MGNVDDRIVAMQFDNAAFEHKIAATMSSLDKLKHSLDFANSKRGIEDLTKASNAFNLQGIATAVEGISNKFSMMGAVAFSVINNIVTRAVDAGIQLGKALSLDQVISGFQEYETNMNSIQTVLANTKSDGTNLQDVNKALDELNEYSDKTIYNFSEMARNIGTFTAAGVNLDTSVEAIKGIANLAAISGSNSQQAATAMYQLSQALASGSVKLMDWNSIVNAGMGGEVFQKALFETGKTLGTIKDTPIDMTFEQWTAAGNTFRGSLETGWLTAEVLTNTLSGFTGDLTEAQIKAMGYNDEQTKQIMEMGKVGQEAATKVKTLTQLVSTLKESIGSGWSASFRTIFGDFEEARTLFTGLSEALGGLAKRSADARNEMLTKWKDLGGRDVMIQSLMYAMKGLSDIMKPIQEAFREFVPAMTGERLYDLTVRLRNFLRSLEPSTRTLENVKNIFRGVFSVLDIGWEIIKNVASSLKELYERFAGAGEGPLAFLGNLGEKIFELREKLVTLGGIDKVFDVITEAVGDFVEKAIEKFGQVKDVVKEVIDYFTGGFTGEFTGEGTGLLLFANNLGTAFGKIKDFISGLFDGGGEDTGEKLGIISSAVDKLGERFGWLTGIGTLLAAGWDTLSANFDTIKTKLTEFLDFVQEKFAGLPQKISDALANTDYSQVLDTINVGLFGGLVLLFKNIASGLNFGDGFLSNVSQALEEVTGVLQSMQLKLKAEALKDIAIALGLLTAS